MNDVHRLYTSGFVKDLAAYIDRRNFRSIYDETVAGFLFWFFDDGQKSGRIPEYEAVGIYHYVPKYLHDAFELLRTSKDIDYVTWRGMFEKVARHEVPDLINVGFDTHRFLLIMYLGYMMADITGHTSMEESVKHYLLAQDEVLNQRLHLFVNQVYVVGLRQLTVESNISRRRGKFGSTTLRAIESAGRIMFTLARTNKRNPTGEDSVTLIGDAGEHAGMRFGIQSCHADLFTACKLIDDVIAHWPSESVKQGEQFQPSDQVGFG